MNLVREPEEEQISLTMGELTFGTPPDGVTPRDEAELRRIEQRDTAPEVDMGGGVVLSDAETWIKSLDIDAETRDILYDALNGPLDEDEDLLDDSDPYDIDPVAFELRRIADALEWFIDNQTTVLSKG